MKPKRIISILLIAALVIGLVAGVAVVTANYVPKGEDPGLIVDGALVEDPGVMLTIGTTDINFDDYRHYYLLNRDYTQSSYGSAGYWDDDVDGAKALNLKQSTEQALVQQLAWLQIAEEQNIALSEEEKQSILQTVTQQKEELGNQFEANLASMYFTSEDQYVRITQDQTLVQKAVTEYEQMVRDANEQRIIDEELVSVKHILFSLPEEGEEAAQSGESTAAEDAAEPEDEDSSAESEAGTSDVLEASSASQAEDSSAASASQSEADSSVAAASGGDEDDEALDDDEMLRQVALSAIEYIRESDDFEAAFDEVREKSSSDAGQAEEGYTFGKGQMDDEFYQASLALEVGEMSEPVKTSFGYHVILRLPLDTEYVEENRATLVDNPISTLLNDKVQRTMESLTVTPGAYYSYVRPNTVK